MSRAGRLAAAAALVVASTVAAAESAYVIDRLLVGVHANKTPQSVIVELIGTGTTLDVLARDGSFVQVKTPNGTRGWVDAQYVAAEKPARLLLAELEAKHRKALEGMATLTAEVKQLRAGAAKAAQTPPPAPPSEETVAELERLREENQELKETITSAEEQLAHLAEIHASVDEAQENEALPSPIDPAGWGLRPWMGWLAAAPFIVGLLLGLLMMDYFQRRRHGGFRV